MVFENENTYGFGEVLEVKVCRHLPILWALMIGNSNSKTTERSVFGLVEQFPTNLGYFHIVAPDCFKSFPAFQIRCCKEKRAPFEKVARNRVVRVGWRQEIDSMSLDEAPDGVGTFNLLSHSKIPWKIPKNL
jgi:hypothetical protein